MGMKWRGGVVGGEVWVMKWRGGVVGVEFG